VAGAINIFFMTSPFRERDRPERQHSVNVTVPLVRPTSDTRNLVAAAVAAVRVHHRPGFPYAKAGVMFSGLQPAGIRQGELDFGSSGDLFSEAPAAGGATPRNPAELMKTVDALNHRFGRDSVRVGTTMVAGRAVKPISKPGIKSAADVRTWAVRQDSRSPRYTTRWDEMPVVQA